jgi:hypothetical protein
LKIGKKLLDSNVLGNSRGLLYKNQLFKLHLFIPQSLLSPSVYLRNLFLLVLPPCRNFFTTTFDSDLYEFISMDDGNKKKIRFSHTSTHTHYIHTSQRHSVEENTVFGDHV